MKYIFRLTSGNTFRSPIVCSFQSSAPQCAGLKALYFFSKYKSIVATQLLLTFEELVPLHGKMPLVIHCILIINPVVWIISCHCFVWNQDDKMRLTLSNSININLLRV